ncbi:DHH phosphoesterase [Artomyces pyxidatus]|uniref:DHH phosphoesterase n=1 Tax=Artomyces pyxidatus TaxID=48021 RepID=A0ACB8STX8_9AGAM|nr:DHH phosphoesterase [Artomyces pyxidatus]
MRRLSIFARRSASDPQTASQLQTTSTAEHDEPESSSTSTSLSHFLHLQKVNYFKAVEQAQGRRQWTIVMGNEAGDLDSLASAIAYAWYATTHLNQLTIPLLQTARADLHLRAENLHALALAGIAPDRLLTSDELPPNPTDKFALVDHNSLSSRFLPSAHVTAVVDHHADEGRHLDARPRIVEVPTGSCSSLVTRLFSTEWPDGATPEVARLLLCAIVIDTGGLKPGGKAEAADRAAAAFLCGRAGMDGGAALTDGQVYENREVRELSETLAAKKASVAHLGPRDLLRRDYKEYEYALSGGGAVLVGLATVPRALKAMLKESEDGREFWNACGAWMEERGLGALGVLTTWRDEAKFGKRGKHRREQVWAVKDKDGLAGRLWRGLEASAELKVKRKDGKKYIATGVGQGVVVHVYEQGNADATRKATAPLVKTLIESK